MPAPHEDVVDSSKSQPDSKHDDAKKQGEQRTRRQRNFLTIDADNPLIVRSID